MGVSTLQITGKMGWNADRKVLGEHRNPLATRKRLSPGMGENEGHEQIHSCWSWDGKSVSEDAAVCPLPCTMLPSSQVRVERSKSWPRRY